MAVIASMKISTYSTPNNLALLIYIITARLPRTLMPRSFRQGFSKYYLLHLLLVLLPYKQHRENKELYLGLRNRLSPVAFRDMLADMFFLEAWSIKQREEI